MTHRRRPIKRRLAPLSGTVLTLAIAAGCGYDTERPFPQTVRSVHVEMFQTRDFRRDLEFKLTDAIIKRIQMDTDYRIETRAKADSVLGGELVQVQLNTLGESFRTGLARETSATYVISYRWADQRTGRVLAQHQRLPYTTTYVRPAGEIFFDSALRGLDGVAELLVESMETPW